jgi:hypothetical protein
MTRPLAWRPCAWSEVAELVEARGLHDEDVGRLCGSNGQGRARRMVQRFKADGLTLDQADRVAVGLGLHPSLVWLGWFDYVEEESVAFDGAADMVVARRAHRRIVNAARAKARYQERREQAQRDRAERAEQVALADWWDAHPDGHVCDRIDGCPAHATPLASEMQAA